MFIQITFNVLTEEEVVKSIQQYIDQSLQSKKHN